MEKELLCMIQLRTIAHVDASNTGEEEIDKKAGSSAKKIRKYYTV